MSRWSIAELLGAPSRGGALDGADRLGEATGGARLVVRIALWLDGVGRIEQARFKATTCASLVASAEAACRLLEDGFDPATLDGAVLRAHLDGLHPIHEDRTDLVARALHRAIARDLYNPETP